MAKLERKMIAHYLAIPGATPVYAVLGVDNEELTVELSAQVDKVENVLGETSITISSYEKSMSVAPYKADAGTPLFEWLQAIIDEQKTLDDLKTYIAEVHMWEQVSANVYKAYREECYVEVTSYGGDTAGYQIPFNVHFTRVREAGTFNVVTKAFTLGAEG